MQYALAVGLSDRPPSGVHLSGTDAEPVRGDPKDVWLNTDITVKGFLQALRPKTRFLDVSPFSVYCKTAPIVVMDFNTQRGFCRVPDKKYTQITHILALSSIDPNGKINEDDSVMLCTEDVEHITPKLVAAHSTFDEGSDELFFARHFNFLNVGEPMGASPSYFLG